MTKVESSVFEAIRKMDPFELEIEELAIAAREKEMLLTEDSKSIFAESTIGTDLVSNSTHY